ncbi:hypothetical protein AWB73_01127 [Caballeronia turbans]|nr:hypothetical protein AWB73_01127 [Caballeronia turbans]
MDVAGADGIGPLQKNYNGPTRGRIWRVLVAGLLMAAGLAHARDWEQANNKVETCLMYGRMGDLYYRMALDGKRPTMHDEAAALEAVRQHIEDEIYSNTAAYDREKAARWAISYCLDHIDAAIHQAQRDGDLPQ